LAAAKKVDAQEEGLGDGEGVLIKLVKELEGVEVPWKSERR
jgi:hypothetical protein